MRRTRHLILALAGSLVLAACETPPTRQDVGTVIGGVVGGVLGAEVSDHGAAGTIIGTLVGAFVGSTIAREMDQNDRRRAAQVLEVSPSGQAGEWVNPDTGARYRVTPIRTYDRAGAPCREYTMDAHIGSKAETVVGTACRQADGTWRVQP